MPFSDFKPGDHAEDVIANTRNELIVLAALTRNLNTVAGAVHTVLLEHQDMFPLRDNLATMVAEIDTRVVALRQSLGDWCEGDSK